MWKNKLLRVFKICALETLGHLRRTWDTGALEEHLRHFVTYDT